MKATSTHRGIAVFLVFMASLALAPWRALANTNDPVGLGRQVVLVYNTKSAASKEIAEHYAELRKVPAGQVLGLELAEGEEISRAEFYASLQKPILKFLEKSKLFTYGKNAAGQQAVVQSSVRYLVLCYGVPVKVSEDPLTKEAQAAKLPEPLRHNYASVDSELCLLPMAPQNLSITGPFINPGYATTNLAAVNPTNGLMIVARLDGPTPAIAKALVDKAMLAETEGLWGRAYFDLRGLSSGEYKAGDDMLKTASADAKRYGFETIVDNQADLFPIAFPFSQCAIYAGWYSGGVVGALAREQVEFMNGAFAYHLHSFSAHVLRSDHENWVGPLLAKGATVTLGCTEEPYLAGTPDIAVLLSRWMFLGFTFGEAALASQPWLSWQTTVVGDPLYSPFAQNPEKLHNHLEEEKSPLIGWSHLRVVNLSLNNNRGSASDMINYMLSNKEAQTNAVMLEKAGDLFFADGKIKESIAAYVQAVNSQPTAQQLVRVALLLGKRLENFDQPLDAFNVLNLLLEKVPSYAEANTVRTKLIQLGTTLGLTNEVTKIRAAMPPPPAAK